ncbi:MAG: type II toxin-antitoxin system Phd/YefM family antitoxin [Rickettsiales bacterium]|nr:MAG: type II toxin-antitoxin system Phd/YefM family antitoxin [Rickettsiales bacterium]
MSKEIQISEFKEQCLKLIDNFSQDSQDLIITKRGKALAKVVPIMDESIGKNFFGLLQNKAVIKGDIVSPLDKIWYAAK